jgi:hypothetical protein
MNSKTNDVATDPVVHLAAKIYVELICRNVVVTESAAQINSNPENLAKISFKLAEAFQLITMELKASKGPINQGFDVQGVDLASWGAPKP